MSSRPGQCPASEKPPLAEQEVVFVRLPVKPMRGWMGIDRRAVVTSTRKSEQNMAFSGRHPLEESAVPIRRAGGHLIVLHQTQQ